MSGFDDDDEDHKPRPMRTRGEWPNVERRTNGHREQLRRAVVDGMEDFFANKDRVKASVHILLEAFQEELSSGAGKYLFKGFSRLFWIAVIASVVLLFGGWTAAVTFIKAVFTH